jgi:hypothetical protein
MPILKFNLPQTDAYAFRQGALREGRALADYVRKCAMRGLAADPPVEMPDAAVDREEMNNGKTTVAAYLSGKLANAIKQIARETGRSQSHIMRDLIRCELCNRGLLAGAVPIAADVAEPPTNTAA